MNTNKYGMVSWDEVETQTTSPNQSRRDLFMRLDAGSNIVRILTKPHEYLMHRYKSDQNDPGYGERVLSSIYHGRDPLMERGLKPKRRWLVGIIDRITQSYKILDMGVSIFKGIQALVRDEDLGDPTQFEVDIKVDKQGGPTGYYTVTPKRPKPLTPADLEIKQMADLEELKRKCTPPTPEQVEERIAVIDAKSKARKSNNGGSTDTADTADTNETNAEADDYDFPAVEEESGS